MRFIGDKLPAAVKPYRRTPHFTEKTVPAALTSAHATKPNVWGVICVVRGTLRYVVPSAGIDVELDPATRGVIAPQQVHYVEPVGEVAFFVEFCK